MSTVAEKVAKGAAWLDENYPQWWEVIDLATLDISNCHRCVLGQVYDVVPFAEKDQLISQLVTHYTGGMADAMRRSALAGEVGGFNIIAEGKDMVRSQEIYDLGFAVPWMQSDADQDRQYAELLDEWTRVIIQRRLDAHPDVAEFSNLDTITDETFAVYATA